MKPLTIEQLKALEVGDWVWIKDQMTDRGMYVQICMNAQGIYLESKNYGVFPNYSHYGKTWLAYKNKEQAECKGEIVELREPRIEPSNSPYGGYTIHWQKVVGDYGWCRDRAQAELRLAELTKE